VVRFASCLDPVCRTIASPVGMSQVTYHDHCSPLWCLYIM